MEDLTHRFVSSLLPHYEDYRGSGVGDLSQGIVLYQFPWSLCGSKTPLKVSRDRENTQCIVKDERICSRLHRAI